MNGIMDYREYLKAQRRIKFLNRSIAQRERNWLWGDIDRLWELKNERGRLQVEMAAYERQDRLNKQYDIWAQ